ncbi:MAG TPA: nucleoside-diphosphate sugar epimerase/dehydratase [Nitriliruptorales bacterium]|nr:nucleoside-diphosphate sugar epimerase/dehydratase [Nitriliruptorales bacterium]
MTERPPDGMSLRRDGLLGTLAARSVRMRADLPLAFLDALLAVSAYTAIMVVRFDGQIPVRYQGNLRWFLPLVVAVHLVANWLGGLYGEMWRHAGVQEARRLTLAGGGALLVLGGGLVRGDLVSGSVVVLGGATTVILYGAVRFQSRLLAFRRRATSPQVRGVVVIGAGDTGAAIVRDMLESEAPLLPAVVLDDDPRKQGRSLHGVPVVAGIPYLPDAVRAFAAEEAILAIPSADGELVRTVANVADEAGVPLRVVPGVGEMVNGRPTVADVRDLRLSDLLGRLQVQTDLAAVRGLLAGRRVMITGGGGSIGSEIARQVATCDPASLLLLDHDETHLYEAAAELDGGCTELLADIRDRQLVDRLVARHRPEVIFHAAAHKHVPMLERHPCEAIRTNVLGTLHVADAAVRHGVERLVLISTDKAVRPSSVMGASKRIAEQIVLSRSDGDRPFCAVRFGNVLGSRGSVIPRFLRQIERGGPVTVTDPRMTRFFMSITEAVQLVLQSAVFSAGREVYMLEMGDPVPILELAQRMIRLSGRRVGTDVPIRIVGARKGEKLSEELFFPEEAPWPTAHPSIFALYPPLIDPAILHSGVSRLAGIAAADDEDEGAGLLHELAASDPGFIPVPDHRVGGLLTETGLRAHDSR